MKFSIKRIILLVLLLIVGYFAISVARNWDTIQRVFLGGVKVYETEAPAVPADIKRPAVLVFSKTNAFRHEDAIPAANKLFEQMAKENGWGIYRTENGAAFNSEILSRFDAVIFNNVSGDVFTPAQRTAFKRYIEQGGGYVGIHAAGDNSHAKWDWYMKEIIGATFTQHTMDPQFQRAAVNVEDKGHPVTKNLPSSWQHVEEWYSFDRSPRKGGANVLITVDEKSYRPVGMFGKDLKMGDHPMVWNRCIGKGRVVYSAFGHQADAFSNPQQVTLLGNAVRWALRLDGTECGALAANEKTK